MFNGVNFFKKFFIIVFIQVFVIFFIIILSNKILINKRLVLLKIGNPSKMLYSSALDYVISEVPFYFFKKSGFVLDKLKKGEVVYLILKQKGIRTKFGRVWVVDSVFKDLPEKGVFIKAEILSFEQHGFFPPNYSFEQKSILPNIIKVRLFIDKDFRKFIGEQKKYTGEILAQIKLNNLGQAELLNVLFF